MTGFVRSLLGLPMLGKVLAGNVTIVLVGATLGTYVVFERARADPALSPWDLIVGLGAVGLVVSFVANYLLLRAALLPIRDLSRAVEAVSAGDFGARAGRSRVRDPQVERFIATFNQVLNDVEVYRLRVSELSSQIISAQEQERKRIARELHDETAQSLTSLLVRLRIAERARTPEEVRAGIAHAREITARALEEVRNLALDLRPSVLDDLGLVPALNWCTDHFERNHDVATQFVTNLSAEDRLPPELEVVIYRVVQEALSNVAKHARAHDVEVELNRDDQSLSVYIADDGTGFDPTALAPSRDGGLGLFGMRERLALVGGTLVIDTRLGHGTRLRARIPIPQSPVSPAAEALCPAMESA